MALEELIKFSNVIGKLKVLKRSGWISQVGITEPESVADHSFRCAVLAMCIGDLTNVDTEKLIKMLLLHDIQEAQTGDYDHHAKREIGLSEVKFRERIAVKDVLSLLPEELSGEYARIWQEFENRRTSEAILAKDIDKIEMMMQALEYEKEGYDSDRLEAFWTDVQNEIRTPMIRGLFKILKHKRRLIDK